MMCKEQEYLSHPSKAVTKVRAAIRNRVKALRTLYQQRRSNAIWETSANRKCEKLIEKKTVDNHVFISHVRSGTGCCKVSHGFAKVAADDNLGGGTSRVCGRSGLCRGYGPVGGHRVVPRDEDLDIDCSFDFFSDLEPLGGDDGESGFRRKVLPRE